MNWNRYIRKLSIHLSLRNSLSYSCKAKFKVLRSCSQRWFARLQGSVRDSARLPTRLGQHYPRRLGSTTHDAWAVLPTTPGQLTHDAWAAYPRRLGSLPTTPGQTSRPHRGFAHLALLTFLGLGMFSCASRGNYPGVEYAPQMYHSVPYDALTQITDKEAGRWLTSGTYNQGEFYNSNPYNPHKMNMRKPPAHVVRRDAPLPYRFPKDSADLAARVLKNPLDSTAAIVKEGKVLYSRFCLPCHGEKGMGDGLVGKVYKGVPAYNSRAIKMRTEGSIFHTITMGKGRMWGYASQIGLDDRWKIVRYVQILQQQ